MGDNRRVVTAPTLAHLRAFRTVVERGSFAAAAEALGSSQPAVSLHVHALEERYGVALLQRLRSGVRLTDAGTVVYARAVAMLRGLDAMEAELAALRGLEGGRLVVGASTTIANYALPAPIGRFKELHPAVAVALEVGNTGAVVVHVAAQRYTLGFIEGPIPPEHAAALQTAPFRADELALVVAGTSSLADRARLTLDELATLPFLMREPGSGTRQVVERALRAVGVDVTPYLELGHTEAIKTAVSMGLGVSILSRQAVACETHTGELRIVPVEGLDLQRVYTAIAPHGTRFTPAEQAFLAIAGVGDAWTGTSC